MLHEESVQTELLLDPLNYDDHPQVIALLNHNRVVNVFHQRDPHQLPSGQQIRLASTIIVSNLTTTDADLCYFILAKKSLAAGGFAQAFDLSGIFIFDSAENALVFRYLSPNEDKWVFKEYGVIRRIYDDDPYIPRPSNAITQEEINYECSLANKLPHLATTALLGQAPYRYLPMKKQPGCDLYHILIEDQNIKGYPFGMLTMQVRLELAILLCRAVISQIHAKGYVHCDLKPENILVDLRQSPFAVNIIDPGLMRKVNTHRLTSGKWGTAGFMAPESMVQGQQITYAFDVYSLGRVISMLFGINSFRKNEYGKSTKDQPNILLQSTYIRKNDVKSIIRNMCFVKPESRYDLFEVIDKFCLLLVELAPYSLVIHQVCTNRFAQVQDVKSASSLFQSLNISPPLDESNFKFLLQESIERYSKEKGTSIQPSYYTNLVNCTTLKQLIVYQVEKIKTFETSLKYNSFLCIFFELAQQKNHLNEIKKMLDIDFIPVESIRTPAPISWSQWAYSFWSHETKENPHQNARDELFQNLSSYTENIESNRDVGEGLFY